MKKGLLAPQNTFLDTIATRFDGTHSNFVLGNAQATGCPVVYCSDGFCELTGFPRSQVMGRSCACKFLFGEETTSVEKEKIESALEQKEELKTELQLYKKDGDKFKCLLDIVPIKNEKSQVVLILVSHKDIGDKTKTEEDDDDTDKSSSELDSDEEMAEAYRRCQARQGRSSGVLPSGAGSYQNQRRRSRAVLYHLSGQFEKHNRANRAKSKLQQLNKFSSSISGKMPEYKVQEVKKSKFILVHYGIFKIGWDWLILLCTFYTAILVPYNAAFTRAEKKNQRDSIYSDVVVEVLFMFDIVFNFRTSFVNKGGQVVYEARLIAINYIKGWFLLDLLAAIPFDFLLIFDINADAPVHLLKLARLIRLARLLQKIDRFSQYSALVLGLLMSMFTLIAHWLACIWYAIGTEEFDQDSTVGWLYELSDRLDLTSDLVHVPNQTINQTSLVSASPASTTIVKPDLFMSYVSALYFTCSSLTSVGFGNVSANTNNEKIFSICAMIVGALMHALVFGNVTALIQRMYQRRANFHSKTKDLKDFFRAYDIPKPLKQRMTEYFQTMWSMNNGIETAEILKDFPEEMKGELGLHLHKEILNLPIFEEATQGCLKSIALHTRRSFCAPGEFLVHKGDASQYLYLLVSGSMEILKMDMVVAILGKGDLFGSDIDMEDPISVCNYDVRSLTYSELQCISLKGLTDVLLLYPDFAEKFAKDIHNDITYNLRQSAEDEDSDGDPSSSPKARVCTLPSISEDDELSPSDDEDDEENKKDKDDQRKHTLEDDDGECSLNNNNISSPLLPLGRMPSKIPNGDIMSEAIQSPPNVRTWGMRRPTGLVTRSSFKDARKGRMAGLQSESVEKMIPHIQNLQNEVEGTKASVTKLDRKVAKISQDICAIDRNMREILRHITNVAKLTPIEPLPPLTPVTPNSTSQPTRFSFDFNESAINEHSPSEHRSMDGSNGTDSPQYSDNSPNTDTDILRQSHVPPKHNKNKHQKERLNLNYSNPKRRSSLQVPLLLNPHDLLTRRYSDGTEDKPKTIFTGVTASKSENVVAPKHQPHVEPKETVRPQSTAKHPKRELPYSPVDHYKDTDKLMLHSPEDTTDFMNSLEDVHSPFCKSPLLGRQLSNSCDAALNREGDEHLSDRTKLANIRGSHSRLHGCHVHRSNIGTSHFKNNNYRDEKIELELLQSLPRPSKSCHEIHKNHVHHKPVAKTKSQSCIETEFAARTPNEVRTVHFPIDKTIPNSFPTKTVLSKENIPGGLHRPIDKVKSADTGKSSTDSLLEELIKEESEKLSQASNLRRLTANRFEASSENLKTDSGNGSLFDNPDYKQGDTYEPSERQCDVHKPLSRTDAEMACGSKPFSMKLLDQRGDILDDVSPDSTTDISESLHTDSLRTVDETILEIEPDSKDMNGLLGQMFNNDALRSTNL